MRNYFIHAEYYRLRIGVIEQLRKAIEPEPQRGRVGRGSAESWCFLLAAENERLRILTQTNDGFIVAQKDLELRGPGDLMGTRQSGEMMADFLLDGDVKLLDEAAKCMKRLREDPKLTAERQQVEAEALRNYRDKLADIAMN